MSVINLKPELETDGLIEKLNQLYCKTTIDLHSKGTAYKFKVEKVSKNYDRKIIVFYGDITILSDIGSDSTYGAQMLYLLEDGYLYYNSVPTPTTIRSNDPVNRDTIKTEEVLLEF